MGMAAPPQEHLAASLQATGQPLAAGDLRAKSDLWLGAHCLALAAHGAAVVVVNDPGAGLHGESKSGGAVEPGELSTGLPEVYGTAPAGRLPEPAVHGA
jgi:hypothetical protein